MIEIKLTKGKIALIDEEDFEIVSQYRWWVLSKGNGRHVAATWTKGSHKTRTRIYMHRLIMGAAAHLVVDHINHDALDNRRANLRLCSTLQNNLNRRKRRTPGATSIYKGVCWDAEYHRWCAQIRLGGRNRKIGRYASEKEAAIAYDRAARRDFGQFACLNFPRNGEPCAVRSQSSLADYMYTRDYTHGGIPQGALQEVS